MNTQLNYWIHGPRAAGKTILARQIVGPEGVRLSARDCSEYIMLKLARGSKRLVIDEYNERSSPCKTLIASAFSEASPATAARFRGTSVALEPALETLVVTSEFPPQDPALIRRFHIISITPPV